MKEKGITFWQVITNAVLLHNALLQECSSFLGVAEKKPCALCRGAKHGPDAKWIPSLLFY